MAAAKGKTAGARKTARERRDEQADESAKLVINGHEYRLDDFELGELVELEDYTGQPMDSLEYGSARVMAFMLYLVRRRDDPAFTLEDALKIRISQVGGGGDAPAEASPDPT